MEALTAFGSKTTSTTEHKFAVKIPPNFCNQIDRGNHEWCHSHFHPWILDGWALVMDEKHHILYIDLKHIQHPGEPSFNPVSYCHLAAAVYPNLLWGYFSGSGMHNCNGYTIPNWLQRLGSIERFDGTGSMGIFPYVPIPMVRLPFLSVLIVKDDRL